MGWCICAFFSTLAQFYRITCVERHSICKCLRRIPSLWLALSIEFAFAAHCMYARITAMSNATKCVVLPSEDSRSFMSATWFAFLSIEMDESWFGGARDGTAKGLAAPFS